MFEIERRFLIENYSADNLKDKALKVIIQTYIPDNTGDWSIRCRRITSAYNTETKITLKKLAGHGKFIEIESDVAPELYDGFFALSNCEITKERFLIPYGDHIIELDYFKNPELEGLVIAEVELSSIDDHFPVPDWFSQEITGDKQYDNHQLFKRIQSNKITGGP
jgi:CYTH domain-containing protein